MAKVVFDQWAPDAPPFMSTGLQVATNVYPGPFGYRPVPKWVGLTTSLPGECLGAATFTYANNDVTIIAGTATALYRFEYGGGWREIGSNYTIPEGGRWRFAQFGELAIATNGVDKMVKINIRFVRKLRNNVTPLEGGPPTSPILAVVRDFLVAGQINGDVRTLKWSGINNAEHWIAAANQSDYQIMPSGGQITGILGGEFGLVLQKNRISRMTYVGDNLVFQFDEIANNMGCVSPHSVAQAGSLGFFLSDNGFMMWDGAQLKPIGFERVDRTFLASYSKVGWENMSTAVDTRNNIVSWAMGDRIFCYNWALDRWSVIAQPVNIVFSGFAREMSLEEVAVMFPDIDLMEPSLDSHFFEEGSPVFFVIDNNDRLGFFGGAPMEATFETGDIEFVAGRETRVSQIRPLTDALTTTMTVEAKDRHGETPRSTDYSFVTNTGSMPIRERGRFLRFRQTLAEGATWTYAQGVDVGTARGLVAGGRR